MKTLIIIFTISIIILVAVFIILAIMAFNKGWNSNKRSKLAKMIKEKTINLCNIAGSVDLGKCKSTKGNPSKTLCYILNCISNNADCIADKFSHQYKYDDKYINNLTSDLLIFALNNNCLDSCGVNSTSSTISWDKDLVAAVEYDVTFIVECYNTLKQKPNSTKIETDVNCVVNYLSTNYRPNQLFGMLFYFLLDINIDGIVQDIKNISPYVLGALTTCKL